ncbi:MAG: helix-turn-helix transcriptional regulator, partial [Bacteroidales bacterium]|nr:helix-turn-helix transcriptional regulator [Bacteroidales bacterium]
FTYLTGIKLSIDTWCVPVTLFLMMEITQPRRLNFRKMALLTLPSIVMTVLYIITALEAVLNTLLIYSLLFGMVMAAGVLMASFKHDNYIKRNFSYTENISVYWVKRVILLLFLMLVVWVLIIWFTEWHADSLFYFFQIAVWIYIYSYTKQHVVVDILQDSLSEDSDSDSEENTKERENVASGDDRLDAKLKRCMENDSLYLNAYLSLSDVAAAIATNRTYLSDFLNNQMNVNFYDYVNNYRVQKACDILLEGEHKRLEEVGERCGFNSLSTFRRAFQKKMNTTPIEYKNKRLKNH